MIKEMISLKWFTSTLRCYVYNKISIFFFFRYMHISLIFLKLMNSIENSKFELPSIIFFLNCAINRHISRHAERFADF